MGDALVVSLVPLLVRRAEVQLARVLATPFGMALDDREHDLRLHFYRLAAAEGVHRRRGWVRLPRRELRERAALKNLFTAQLIQERGRAWVEASRAMLDAQWEAMIDQGLV
jgi:hypothetical protein